MQKNSVKTGVDALIELLGKHETIALSQAAKELSMDEKAIKQWVDFLVEEKIIGIEYKFTKPYIYLNKPKENQTKMKVIEEKKVALKDFKEEFEKRANKSNIPKEQIGFLWKDHLQNQLALENQFFLREARKHGFTNEAQLWQEFVDKVQKDGFK